MKKILYSKKAAPYVFILPFVLTFAVFWLVPLIKSGIMSTQKILPGQETFIAADNFIRLFSDRIFMIAVANSFKYMIFTLILLIPIPMVLACLVNSKLVRGKIKGVFKASLFIPALTSVVVAGELRPGRNLLRLQFRSLSQRLCTYLQSVFTAAWQCSMKATCCIRATILRTISA